MFETPAHIVNEVMDSFGELPPEILSVKHVVNGLTESFADRGLSAQQSSAGRLSSLLSLPSLTERDTRLDAAVSMPLSVERRVGSSPRETWVFVHYVDPNVLEESRLRGDSRCSFYRDADNRKWHLTLTYDPSGIEHRLWYWADPAAITSLTDPLFHPSRFGVMFKYDTQIHVVPPMLMRAANLPEDGQLTSSQLNAINTVLAHAKSELEKPGGWNDKYEIEIRSDKAVRGRMRRPILARGVGYPRTY